MGREKLLRGTSAALADCSLAVVCSLQEVYRPHKSIEPELCLFHSHEYINFLSAVSPDNYKDFALQLKSFNVGEATDCPVFDGLFTFQQACAGAWSVSCSHHTGGLEWTWFQACC